MSNINVYANTNTHPVTICEKEKESSRSLVPKDRASWKVPFLVGSSRVEVPLDLDGKISLRTGQRVTCRGGFAPQYCEFRDICPKTPRVESTIFNGQFQRAETPSTVIGDNLTLVVKP